MPIHAIQTSFAGGEFAPSLFSRVDLARYQTGLRKAKNVFIHPHGGASNRPGLKFIAETKFPDKAARVVDFEFSTTQAYIIEFGDFYARFFRNGAPILDGAGPAVFEIVTPYSEAQIFDLKFAQSADVLYIVHPKFSPRELTRADHDDWTLSLYDFKNGPFMLTNTDEASLISLLGTPGPSDFVDDFESGLGLWTIFGNIQINSRLGSNRLTNRDVVGFGLTGHAQAAHTIAFGTWQFDLTQRLNAVNLTYFDVRFIDNTADYYSLVFSGPNINVVTLTKNGSALASSSMTGGQDAIITIRIERDDNGTFRIFENNAIRITHVDSTITTSTRIDVFIHSTNDSLQGQAWFDNIFISPQATPSTGITGTIDMVASKPIFDAGQIGYLFRLNHEIEAQTIRTVFTAAGTSAVIRVQGTFRIFTSGAWTGKFFIEKSTDDGVTFQTVRAFSSTNDNNVDTFGEIEKLALIRLRVPSPPIFTGTLTTDLSTDAFTQEGIVKITAFTDTKNVEALVLANVGSIDPIFDWAEGSWSDFRGFPRAVVFFQDRLTFAASDTEPQTIWMSQTSIYDEFKRNTPLLDSDGITVNLPSQKVNIIRNLVALNEIVALTSADDWEVGSDTGIITPTTIRTRPRGFRGSSKVSPVLVGTRAIVVQPIGSTIRDILSTELEGFQGSNISIISNHLFQGFTVIEMTYSQEPDSLVWVIRSDGKLLSLTYIVEQEVLAWTRHETDGLFESTTTIPGTDFDETWFVVKRGSKRFIEQMQKRLPNTDPQDQFFVDAGLSLDIPKAITGATQANPVVISSVGHGFVTGNIIDIRLGTVTVLNENEQDESTIFTGMGELNNKRFKIKNETANTYELTDEDDNDIDGTAFSAFDEDGEARKTETVITGLGHLEGRTVACLANGSVEPQKVVNSGQITITNRASTVHVGLPYQSEIETLSIEAGLRDGTLQGRKVKIDELTIRLLDTRGLKAGPSNGRNLDPLTSRTSEVLGAPMKLFTGDVRLEFQGGYEDFGRVLLRQDDPLPMTVIALIPRFTPGSR